MGLGSSSAEKQRPARGSGPQGEAEVVAEQLSNASESPPVRANATATREFLSLLAKLAPGRSALVTTCLLGRGGMEGFTLDALQPGQLLKAVEIIERRTASGEQVYFAVNAPKECVRKKPSKEETGPARYAHVEIDPDAFMKAKGGYDAARAHLHDEVVAAMKASSNPPTVIWSSGNGISALWALREPLEHDKVELLNRRLVKKWGGDPGTHNVDRVLRLPGTINWPTKKKIAKGYPDRARLAAVLHQDPEARYTPEQLAKDLPEVSAAEAAEAAGAPPPSPGAATLAPEEVAALEERFELDLQTDVILAGRWEGKTKPPKDGSRSGMDFSFGAMLKARDYRYEELRHLIIAYEHGAGAEKAKEGDERYFQRIWANTNPGITVEEVLQDLESELDLYGTLATEYWTKRLWEARLDPAGQERVLAKLVELGVAKKRAINTTWKQAREKYLAEYRRRRAEQSVELKVGERKKLLWDETNMRKMLVETERAMLARPMPELALLHNGESYITLRVRPPTGFAAIDKTSEAPDTVLFSTFDKIAMQLRIEHSIGFVEKCKDGHKAVPVPWQITQAMLHNPLPETPRTSGLVPHPLVLPDGTYVAEEGPQAGTGLYLFFGVDRGYFEAPPPLTGDGLAQAREALTLLEHELYGEFPFADRLDLVVAMSMTFALLARKMLDICPGYLWNASERGVGKTTGVRLNHIMATGHDLAVASLGKDGEELDKFIMSILIEQLALVCFDNLEPEGTLQSTTLAKLTTAPTYTGRLLGLNKVATLPSNVMWAMTGNGIEMDEDLAERILRVDLRPFKKKHFEHADVLAHGRRIRSAVIRAVHTVQRNYIAAGAPVLADPSRFPAWDRMARMPLLWVTGVDVATKLEHTKDESPERTLDKAAVRLLREVFEEKPFSASSCQGQLKRLMEFSGMETSGEKKPAEHLYEVIAQRCPRGIQSPDSLGRYFSKLRNRAYGSPALVLRRLEGDKGIVYRVEEAA